MKRTLRTVTWTLAALVGVAAGGLFYAKGRGVSARPDPSWVEVRSALLLRSWLTPPIYTGLKNPVSASADTFTTGLEHFADHCASCHGNDGSGDTEMGRNFYPKAPDMRLPRTQDLSDGELFNIIENGVRLTGMPAWSTGTPDGERSSWQLVHFIRRLPALTPDDLETMTRLNPRSRAQIEEELRIEEFLNGSDPTPPADPDPHAAHQPAKPPQG